MVSSRPSLTALSGGRQQLLDLSGHGRLDLVEFAGSTPGFFERTPEGGWESFEAFRSMPVLDWGSPNLKFVDLTGDGFLDLLISEDNAFSWHASLAADGFGPAQRTLQSFDEEKGPKLVFADGSESIFLADLSGDGLTDLVRIRNGGVCYWPNLGYGRFGAKVTMDGSPRFARPDLFDGRRIRLADVDGSGTTDMIYFADSAVDLYLNQSGNAWGAKRTLRHFPRLESVSSATALDLLGNGTACLVWSSPLPDGSRRAMRYIDLMGGQKPHLLVRATNNLGTETVVKYAPSTKFYVVDKLAGTPWVTRLPFPVQVVEQVQTFDYISRNVFVTRYAYHHGFYDGVEREFRGFGRVDQWDTGELAALSGSAGIPTPVNLDATSSLPPVHTKTWFHTGAFFGATRISKHFEHEYYSEASAGLTSAQLEAMLLEDTMLPAGILLQDGSRLNFDFSGEELREACRALRGSILRQELYALDDSEEADRPYSVSERSYTIEALQPQGPSLYGVFFVHPRETVDFHYERKLFKVMGNTLAAPNAPLPARDAADPRVTHSLTLAVDGFGNVLQSAAIGYGRRYLDPALSLTDQDTQSATLSTYSSSAFTNPVLAPDIHRLPLPAEASKYELIQVQPSGSQADVTNLFRIEELRAQIQSASDGRHDILFENVNPSGLNAGHPYRRLIERTRTVYRPDDMGAAAGDPKALLPLLHMESMALPGASYKLTFTPGLISQVYQRGGAALIALPATIFGSVAADGGGYIDLDGDGHWWAPSGRVYYHPAAPASPQEKNQALQHFFTARRFEDAFGNATTVDQDSQDLLVVSSTDSVGNTILAANNYRVLAPALITDPNGNQAGVSFDSFGLVAATAVMGKPGENLGDLLTGFSADLLPSEIDAFYDANDPHALAVPLLGNATTRVVYDLNRFFNSRNNAPSDPSKWLPPFAATIARETHFSSLPAGQTGTLQINFSYSDGYGREIQKKIQAESGPAFEGGPMVDPRWVGSGWIIFNNKGKPVRKFEPFFSQFPAKGHQFEFGVAFGVSAIQCYDPTERVVATLFPNHTYEKIRTDPWRQEIWDVNDNVAEDDPTSDPDVGGFFKRLPSADFLPSWRVQRAGGGLGPEEQDAATKAAVHAGTPGVAYLDCLGRSFLTIADNAGAGKIPAHVELDIQNNQRSVTDALGRKVMVTQHSVLGQRIHQASMESGGRWMLNDAVGKVIRAWDSRGHSFRTEYDSLRRPLNLFVLGSGGANSDSRTIAGEIQFEKIIYGEGQPRDQTLNLRTRVFQHYDCAGVVMNVVADPLTKKDVGYDFKGNLLRSSRQYIQDYEGLPDWSKAAPALLLDVFTSITEYDALNRIAAATSSDGSVIRPVYNEANLLDSLSVNLLNSASATQFVGNIDYNARGQRVTIAYGDTVAPVASTGYTYDPLNFRLANLTTTRPAFAANQQTVQDLSYLYDPSGNITHIQDDADIQNVVYFNNRRVEPSNDYTYDAIYRLVQASGREYLGKNGGAPFAPSSTSYNDAPRVRLVGTGDGTAMGTYLERYEYDDAGNFSKLIHSGSDPANPGWTRSYTYSEASLLEPGRMSNRLTSTTVPGSVPLNEIYQYDLHGNMTGMPQLQSLLWDFKDRLITTRRQSVNANDADGILHQGERAFYVYSATGDRVRKTTQSSAGVKTRERFYLGAMEVYREYNGAGNITLERETLHIMDDKRRVALVETKTVDAASAPGFLPSPVIRYQFDNHLGTACLELDDVGAVVSYEEYYPYGSTSYQAGRTLAEVSLKRYRYSSKERDEETGFQYHGARYYVPWLAKWASCDPAGLSDSVNLYRYVRSNPIKLVDPNGTDSSDPQPELVSPPLKWMFHPLSSIHSRLTIDSSRATLVFAGTVQFAESQLLSKKDLTGRNPDVASSGAYVHTGYLSLDTNVGRLSLSADISLDRHFTGLGSLPSDYRLRATFSPVFKETGSGFDLLRFSGSLRETLYGIDFSGDMHTGKLPKNIEDYGRLASGLISSFSHGESFLGGTSKFATHTLGLELTYSAKLKLLNFIPTTWISGHLGDSTAFTAYGLVAAPAGSLFPVTAPLIGAYTSHSEGNRSYEVLGGALVVPSIEAITKGQGGLEALPTYGFLKSSVSLSHVGPGTLKLGVEASLSAKELVKPTSQVKDFNQIYDILHGAQPGYPAAFKGTATLTYTY